MATRKKFKDDSVGRARQALKAKQRLNTREPTSATKKALVKAEKNLLFEINVKKKRKNAAKVQK